MSCGTTLRKLNHHSIILQSQKFILLCTVLFFIIIIFIFLDFEPLLHCHWPLPFGITMVFLWYFTMTKELPRLSLSCLWLSPMKFVSVQNTSKLPCEAYHYASLCFRHAPLSLASVLCFGIEGCFLNCTFNFYVIYIIHIKAQVLISYRIEVVKKNAFFNRHGMCNFISFIYVCLRHIRSPVGVTLMSASCTCISDILSESSEWNRWD